MIEELRAIFDEYIEKGTSLLKEREGEFYHDDSTLYDTLKDVAGRKGYKVKTRLEDKPTYATDTLVHRLPLARLRQIKIPIRRDPVILPGGNLKLVFEPRGWHVNELVEVGVSRRGNEEEAKEKLKRLLDQSYSVVEKKAFGQYEEARELLFSLS